MSAARLVVLVPSLLETFNAGGDSLDNMTRRCARLLARGDLTTTVPVDFETALLALCGWTAAPRSGLPLAGITAAFDFDLPQTPADRLRADPVHLRADPSRIMLFDAETVGITAAEADSLLDALNAALGTHGVRFSRGVSPIRWYVELPQIQDAGLRSPRALNGSIVENYLGELRRAGELNRLLTEVQMVLHGAAVNDVRAANGRPPLNSVWFWGTGTPPPMTLEAPAILIGADDLTAACARHMRCAHERDVAMLTTVVQRGQHKTIVLVMDSASVALPAFHVDVLAPACTALRNGTLVDIDIHVHGARLAMTQRSHWRWWRRASTFLHQAEAARNVARLADH